jgi:hypothetical protein
METSEVKKTDRKEFTPRERFEYRQAKKISDVEENGNAIVIVPQSEATRVLINSILIFDALDGVIRANAGFNISEEVFSTQIKEFQTLSKQIQDVNEKVMALVANSNIRTTSILNRKAREAIQDLKKSSAKKTAEATVEEKTKTAKK